MKFEVSTLGNQLANAHMQREQTKDLKLFHSHYILAQTASTSGEFRPPSGRLSLGTAAKQCLNSGGGQKPYANHLMLSLQNRNGVNAACSGCRETRVACSHCGVLFLGVRKRLVVSLGLFSALVFERCSAW